jgi:hypothetical protein
VSICHAHINSCQVCLLSSSSSFCCLSKHLDNNLQFPNYQHPIFKMSGTSNVGNSQVYEAGDQRTVPDSQIEQEKKDARFHEGKENSHKANDSSKYFSMDDTAARLTCHQQRTRDRSPTSLLAKRRFVCRQSSSWSTRGRRDSSLVNKCAAREGR